MAVLYRQIEGLEVLYCTDPFAFRPHIHNRYVVWLNTGCGEHYRIKGESDILQPGAISIFEPGLVHANHPCAGNLRRLCSFYVAPRFFETAAAQCGSSPARGICFDKKVVRDRELWREMAGLHRDFFEGPAGPELDARSLELFSTLLVRHGGIREKSRCAGGPGPDRCDRRVSRAIEYFHAHISEEIRLPDLAGRLGCSQFHLIRLFRVHKGLSPHAFLLQIRLEHARHLLEKGEPIAKTAADAGFADQSHLTRAFKARFGITPLAYRTGLNS